LPSAPPELRSVVARGMRRIVNERLRPLDQVGHLVLDLACARRQLIARRPGVVDALPDPTRELPRVRCESLAGPGRERGREVFLPSAGASSNAVTAPATPPSRNHPNDSR